MPIPSTGISVSGTPITSAPGQGGIIGNAITLGGLSVQPGLPGWALTQSAGGPGYVSGQWAYGPVSTIAARGGMPNTPGWIGAPGQSQGGGSGGESPEFEGFALGQNNGSKLTPAGWAVLLLIAVSILKGGK